MCRLAHAAFFLVAVVSLHWNYVVLYCSLLGTTLHLLALYLLWRRADCLHISTSRSWLRFVSANGVVAMVSVIDAGLIALTRVDVQCKLNSSSNLAGQQRLYCGLSPAVLHSLSNQTTQIFQFIVVFFMLLVLADSHAVLVGGLCVLVYSATSLSAIDPVEDAFREISGHMDLLILVAVYAISVKAKLQMVKFKGMSINDNEASDHVVQEQGLRGRSESTCELVSRAAANQAVCTTFGVQDAAARANPEHSDDVL